MTTISAVTEDLLHRQQKSKQILDMHYSSHDMQYLLTFTSAAAKVEHASDYD